MKQSAPKRRLKPPPMQPISIKLPEDQRLYMSRNIARGEYAEFIRCAVSEKIQRDDPKWLERSNGRGSK